MFGVLRLILEWGRDRGLIAHNHAIRPKKLYKADRSDKLWLPHHLDAFRAVAPPQMRLALELALWTGQRLSDLLRLGWASYDGKRIAFRQGKRRRKVDMPFAAPLKALLDATPKKALTILTAPNGKPWRVDPKPTHFQQCWRKTAGLSRAKAEGKALGRPSSLDAKQLAEVRRKRSEGVSLGTLAKAYGVSRAAIQRAEKRA